MRPSRPTLLAILVLALVGALVGTPAGAAPAAAEPTVVTNTAPPAVTGTPAYGEVLTATGGSWTPAETTLAYQWLRDGSPLAGATTARYRPGLEDIGHDLLVEVTASAPGATPVTVPSASVRVVPGTLTPVALPAIRGKRRFAHTLTAGPGTWSHRPTRVRYQWLRAGEVVPGATHRRFHLGLAEFGKRVSVRVTVRRPGFHAAVAERRTGRVKHRVAARHTVTYHVETRGSITADVATFMRLAQQTYDDPRGWRGSGIVFKRVASGGDLTLVLAQAATVPGFSSACSSEWSCRVGRFVIINQTRWLHASPMWHAQHETLRDYRHMVVNHETGHWLGHSHRFCTGAGHLAPVMQQQSKGLQGCRPNPWPTAAERRTPRFG